MEPSATVAICTRQRPGALAAALRALAVQLDPGVPWDVLVVDDDPAGSAEATFEAARSRLAVPAALLAGSGAGSTAARARAARSAAGTITVFIDDDVVPEPGWLRALVTPIVHGRCDGTGGSVLLDPTVARPRWLDEAGVGGLLARFHMSDHERGLEGGEFVSTANAAFDTATLRAAMEEETGSSIRIGRGADMNDDVHISRRFAAAGGRLRYTPDAVVVHRLPAERLRPGYVVRRAHAQGRADWRSAAGERAGRRFGGSRVALAWLAKELRSRAREGPWRPAVAFHAVCDLARTTGALREAVALARDGRL